MKTILVIDDEKAIREMMTMMLKEKYNVLLAENGAEGIHLAQNNNIDLVITDIQMPGITGNEVCKKIQEINPDIKTIGMSGTPWLMNDGLFDHTFEKPFSVKNVYDKIRELLA